MAGQPAGEPKTLVQPLAGPPQSLAGCDGPLMWTQFEMVSAKAKILSQSLVNLPHTVLIHVLSFICSDRREAHKGRCLPKYIRHVAGRICTGHRGRPSSRLISNCTHCFILWSKRMGNRQCDDCVQLLRLRHTCTRMQHKHPGTGVFLHSELSRNWINPEREEFPMLRNQPVRRDKCLVCEILNSDPRSVNYGTRILYHCFRLNPRFCIEGQTWDDCFCR